MSIHAKSIVACIAVGTGLAAAGCASVGIGVTNAGDIRRNAASFEGREVTVRGTVNEVTKLPITEVKSYTVLDSTGEIRVTTRGAAPNPVPQSRL